MKKEMLRHLYTDFFAQAKELKRLWTDYVKEQGEVDLEGFYIVMWDGAGERMSKLLYRDGEVFLKDVFGNEWRFEEDIGMETLTGLYDFMFVKKESSSGE